MVSYENHIAESGNRKQHRTTHSLARKLAVLKRYDARRILESARTMLEKTLHPLPFEPFLKELDAVAIEAIRASCYDAKDSTGAPSSREGLKYLNARKYVPVSVRRVQELNLNQVSPQRILDIGSGAGYFLFVARKLGHDVVGLDTDDVAAYDAMMQLLEIPRVTHRIEPFALLPNLGAPFDLITGFQIRFNRANASWKSGRWELEQWDFFLHDLSTHLRPGGQIFLRFNKESKDCYITEELHQFFRARGGDVRRTSVSFHAGYSI